MGDMAANSVSFRQRTTLHVLKLLRRLLRVVYVRTYQLWVDAHLHALFLLSPELLLLSLFVRPEILLRVLVYHVYPVLSVLQLFFLELFQPRLLVLYLL